MRLKIIAASTAAKAINKARVTGKLSLVAVTKLNLLHYYMEFALAQIAAGVEEYKDKYEQLVNIHKCLVNSCPDIICNIREASCSSDEYENGANLTIKNPYNPVAPVTPPPTPEPENLPPTIGDNTLTVDNNVVTVLTLDMFTSQTIAPYNDPEGDLIDAIRIDRINGTNQGVFKVSNIDIVVGQIITREQIDAGDFTHHGADINTVASDSFDFSARDEGSQIWVQ
jgi:hypothetical protein